MAKRNKITWTGNKKHREFHRVEAGKPQPKDCQLNEITDKHRVVFRTATEARAAGYDACDYCTKKFKSRR
jgi:hypothetical protein